MDKVDSSMDPEVLEARLNLSRPELSGVRRRYFPRSALVVGRSVDDSANLKAALLEAGWQIRSCIDPARANCPLLKGVEPCAKRVTADVAVVFVDTSRSITGTLPLVRCAADPSSPAVLALEGEADAPVIEGNRALVGALRTTRSIVETVDEIAGAHT